MKIYFSGSVRAGRGDQDFYFRVIGELKKYGEVLTEHLGNKSLSDQGEQSVTDEYIFERDFKWLKEADVLVGEVSVPSLGVGYEIGQADSMGKKVCLLYRPQEGKKLSVMLSGNSRLKIFKYENAVEIPKIFENYFKEV